MREIKFRAWSSNEMWYNIDLLKDGHIKIWRGQYAGAFEPKIFELMQFTGLKDKHGVEIYEGDIIKSPDMICLAVVKYEYYSYVLFAKDTTYDYFDYYENFEVIGNIYDNKELLK